MLRFVPIAVLNLCLLSGAVAQDDTVTVRTPELSLHGGTSFPYLPEYTRNFLKTGWTAGGSYGWVFTPGSIGYSSLLVDAEYTRFAFDVTGFRTDQNLLQRNVSLTRNPTTIFDAMLCYKGTFAPGGRIPAPYFLFGVGYMHFSEGDIAVTGDTAYAISGKSQSSVAWTFGAGVEYPVTDNLRIFAQMRSNLAVTDPTRQFFPLSGGISYRLGQ